MTNYLKDYKSPDFYITNIELAIDLNEGLTQVKSRLKVVANQTENQNGAEPLILSGENLLLKTVKLNGALLTEGGYQCTAAQLIIHSVLKEFELEIITEIKPEENTALSGLYKSNDMYCTQCEAEGFRRITYYLDRPDVMAKFTTTITADKQKYPVLLANGNLVASGELANGRHWVKWEDPFNKPSYLFAMVAGDLKALSDEYTTKSGRKVDLKIYVESENIAKTKHAMIALKKSMRWDEENYGREYDLDIYMIVAVNDFNSGAMENKGLNIFNSKYILASNKTATDQDFAGVDIVVGHEYFHNWSGNRITLRDWFQLSLKEGFTVFREQQFTHDISASPVTRIEEVELLRAKQFPEDSGPMAHPVQPSAYEEINNFYTMTVYEKGAEVIRMLHTILGAEIFRKGADLYFARHDGQAAIVEDFVVAMESVSGLNLTQFKLWYTQAGTPELSFAEHYDQANAKYELTLEQKCPETLGQANKKPMYIPVKIGLLASAGSEILRDGLEGKILTLTEAKQTFVFNNITTEPTLSLLRDFSAPVKLSSKRTATDLKFLLKHESNAFACWNAGRELCEQEVFKLIGQLQAQKVKAADKVNLQLDSQIAEVLSSVLQDNKVHLALKAKIFQFATNSELLAKMQVADPEAVFVANGFFRKSLAEQLKSELLAVYIKLNDGKAYEYNSEQVAKRMLKNTCLALLALTADNDMLQLAVEQYQLADNMTDVMAVLQALNHVNCSQREQVFAGFYQRWLSEPLVINKWLGLQASSELDITLTKVKQLLKDKAFDISNPNKVYALVGGFAINNPIRFHAASGEGYEFLTKLLLKLDQLNPQVAARMFSPFSQWQRFNQSRQQLMQSELHKLQASPLSKDLREMVAKTLGENLTQ